MRILYVLLAVSVCMALLYCGVRALKKKKAYKKIIFALEIALTLAVVGSFLGHITHDADLAYLAYAIFYSAMDWSVLILLKFIYEYMAGRQNHVKASCLLYILAVMDTLGMAINCVRHILFRLEETTYSAGWSYYRLTDLGFPFLLHLIFLYSMVAAVFVILMLAINKVSKLYRKSYWIFAIIFFFVTLVDVIFSVSNYPMRLSTVLYGLLGVATYYYALEYAHHDIVNLSMEQLLKNVNCAIMLFDVYKRLLYINPRAREMFGIPSEDVSAAEKLNREYYEKYINENKLVHQSIEESVIDGKMHYLEKEYYFISDEQGYPIGNAIMVTDRTEEYERLDREHFLLTHDSLTGLYTMERFFEATREMLDMHPDTEFCMICSNIKDFKLINELFGMHRGDEVLITQASLMQQLVQKPGTYGRIGGDKFAVCLPIERFQENMFVKGVKKMQNEYTSSVYRMHVYVGVYNIKNRDEAVSLMCDRCNLAIQSITGDYTKCVAYCEDEMIAAAVEDNHLRSEFEDALTGGQFQIYLQPQVNREGEMCGAEALVRWIHPEMGLITPNRFIPLFERSALIHRLDRYIWEEAVKTLRRWSEMGHEDTYISVNISVKDFFYLDIYQEMTDLVSEYQVDPKRLKLEITESVFLVNPSSRMDLIQRLRDYGFEVELDDFGSGYSSLSLLKDIRTDALKVDRGFLLSASMEKRGYTVLKNIHYLADELDMNVIVEGIETEEQLKMMNEIGDNIYQGFYFSKPIPVREFELKYKMN